MTVKNKKPEIRFKGFTDKWESRELGEITLKIGSGKTPKGGDNTYVLEGIALLRSQNIHDDLVDLNDVAYITPQTHEGMINSQVVTKDVLLNITGASIGRSAVYNHYSKVNVNQHVCIIRPIKGYSPEFIQLNLTSPSGQEKIGNNQAGGGREGLNFQQIGRMCFVFPSVAEQSQIGIFFQNLDSFIILQQRTYDKLTTVKKAMLENMFPKDGADVPEIRFKGFTGKWERRKLGEITTPFAEPIPTPHVGYWRLGIRSHAKGTFHSYVGPGRELETAQMHKVSANNLIVNITFAWEHAVAISNDNDAGKLVSHRFPQFSFNDGMIPEYFKFLILDDRFRQHLWLSSPGGAGRNKVLKITEMLEYQLWVPNSIEQSKIATFFQNLDSLISLQQRELVNLKNIKKSFLEKMFV